MAPSNDACERLRQLRINVAGVIQELESLRNSPSLTSEMQLQLEEAASWFAGGADLLTPISGHRVRRTCLKGP
jgi:hypothetical protein